MEETRGKVLALYEGVIDLLNEGADINTLTVSDITKRAGIGKGTAYDYFSSKEEIIAKALLYYFRQKVKLLEAKLAGTKGFQEKLFTVLEWVGENCVENRCISHIFKINLNACEIRSNIREECNREGCFEDDIMRVPVLADIVAAGRAEGAIAGDIPDHFAKLTIAGQAIQYAVFMNLKDETIRTDAGKLREFVYQSILKILK